MIRGLDTTVKRLRRKVFEEVARLGFEANDETLCRRHGSNSICYGE